MALTSPKRVLIISASIGGGHVAAGRALEHAFRQAQIQVRHVDMLDFTTAPFRRIYRQTYFDLVRSAPDLVDWLGRRMDRMPSETKSRNQRIRARFVRLVSYRLPRLIHEYAPDVVVHTHFLPPEILGARSTKLVVPQVEVITDYAAHSLWLQPNIRRYFVAAHEVAVHLNSAGVDKQRIQVTGIPIDARFAALEPKDEARRMLGIPADRDTLLVMAGGLDRKVLLGLVTSLKELRYPLTVFIICGRSEALADSVKHAIDGYTGLISFQVFGFLQDVPRYMAAADLMVGKPGGLTSSEALAAGLPFAVVQPYPLQEEANANYLLEHGVGMRIEPLTLLNHKLRSFFEDTEKRERMRAAALRLAKPRAAVDIVASLLSDPLGA